MDKPKFNILDGFIAVLLIAVIAVGAFFVKGMWTNEPENKEGVKKNAVFKVQVIGIEEELAEDFVKAMQSGETMWVGVKERIECSIQDVEVVPAARTTTDAVKGKIIKTENPTRRDVNITLKTAVDESEKGVSALGNYIRVGDTASIRCKDISGSGYITELEIVNE